MKKLFYIVPLILAFGFTSCQKVIDVDLNSAEPKIVIEAYLANDGTCSIWLTQTVNFDEPNNFPPVSGAVIRLSDDAGKSELISESTVTPGFYYGTTISGMPGRTYTLEVTVDGKTYTAKEKMADTVSIDSVNLQKGFFRDVNNIHVYFTDPKGLENWYRITHVVNNEVRNTLDVTEDIGRDGQQFDATLFVGEDDTLKSNDSVYIQLWNIDKGSYKYYSTLFQAEGGGDPGATPANPVSNFSNGALGFFSVYGWTEKWFVVP